MSHPVVSIDEIADLLSGITDIHIIIQVNSIVLKCAEPSLNHDVICPTFLTIHTYFDTMLFEVVGVLIACKLTTLVRI